MFEALLKKEIWTDPKSPAVLGQSYHAAYVKDFQSGRLEKLYKESIQELQLRIADYDYEAGLQNKLK